VLENRQTLSLHLEINRAVHRILAAAQPFSFNVNAKGWLCDFNLYDESEEMMDNNTRRITPADVQQVGAALGLDWNKIDPGQFRRGLEVELEHGARDPDTDVTHDDLTMTGRIAWAHLKEFPDYYTRLDKLEAEADTYWASRAEDAPGQS